MDFLDQSSSITKETRGWFDNLCADSRANFIANDQHSKVHKETTSKRDGDLMSADECYNFIRTNMRRDMNEDTLWKLPLILLIIGCLLVFVMCFCMFCQFLFRKIMGSQLEKQINKIDMRQAEEQNSPIFRQSKTQVKDSHTYCSCGS